MANTAFDFTDKIKDLLKANGFSQEAIYFICRYNANRYLPLLATLANYSAKNICPSYYGIKSLLLGCVPVVAHLHGWKTFQSYDGDTSNYPYIFYIETGYTPQVSFHSDREYGVNSAIGKWSGVSVQEIAPKLIQNLLKKDGFKGEVWDIKLIAVNIITAAGVVEVSHLHKGSDYIFSVENEELVVTCQGQVVTPSKVLLQSLMTRLAKNKKSANTEGANLRSETATDEEQEDSNDTNPSQEIGAGKDCGEKKALEDGSTSLPEMPSDFENATPVEGAEGIREIDLDEYASSLESESISQEKLSPCAQGLEIAPDESNTATQHAVGQTCIDQAEVETTATTEIIEQDANSLPKQVKEVVPTIEPKIGSEGAGNQSFNTLLEDMQSQGISRSKASDFKSTNVKDNRTFDEHSFKGKPRQNQRITDALRRVASGVSLSQRDFGNDHWDGRKLVRALTVAPHTLASAKYSRPPQKTYFFIDTNCKNCGNEHCSWVNYSEFSMMLIASGLNSESIEVWSGSKCRPERDERAAAQKLRKSPTLNQNIQDWIELVQPEAGSRIVFWGECYNISIEPNKLKKVLSPYKAVWLDCLDKESSFYKDFLRKAERRAKNAGKIAAETEYELLKLAGVTVVKKCDDTDGFVRGLNTIL